MMPREILARGLIFSLRHARKPNPRSDETLDRSIILGAEHRKLR